MREHRAVKGAYSNGDDWMIGPEASDDELVERTAKGDTIAFAQLVGRHRSRLIALITRSLGNRAAAEDIVQDTFTRAWINAPSWQARAPGRAGYAAWLSRVAINLAIDQTRKVKPLPIEDVAEPVDPHLTPDETMLSRERARRVRDAVTALPERQRIAISLTYDAELSNAEGAAAMDTSVGAFELLLVRARRALRMALTDE